MERHKRGAMILDHAGELFARKGISATTVRDIAAGAGMLSGSLYHYFPSKDAMADQIVTAYLDELVARYAAIVDDELPARERLRALAVASAQVSRDHGNASVIYQRETAYLRESAAAGEIREAAHAIRETWVSTIERAVETGVVRADVSPELLYLLLRDAVWVTLRTVVTDRPGDDEAVAEAIVSVYLDGAAVAG